MSVAPVIDTSVPQPEFSDKGVLLPDEQDILAAVVSDDNAAFGNTLDYYDASGNFAQSRPQAQLAATKSAIINNAFGMLAYLANSFDPAVASGRIQDGIAAINFLTRKGANSTTVSCLLRGATGTPIPKGAQAQDTSGNVYACSEAVSIGADGTVTVDFVCTVSGPVSCPANTLTKISQIVPGWDSITNPSAGIAGNNAEGRADFEARRQQSVASKGSTTTGSILSAVKAVSGVIDAYVTDNRTKADKVIGNVKVPATGVLVSVAGGDDHSVAEAIFTKIAGGTPLGGDTTVTVSDDSNGYAQPYPTTKITFQRAISTPVYCRVTLADNAAIPSTAQASIQAACVAAFNGQGIAETSQEKINSVIYGSDFVDDVRSLGAWAKIVSIQVSLNRSAWSDTVAVNAAQIPTMVAGNVSMETA